MGFIDFLTLRWRKAKIKLKKSRRKSWSQVTLRFAPSPRVPGTSAGPGQRFSIGFLPATGAESLSFDRGYRSGPFHQGIHRRHPGRHDLAGPGLGRGPGLPDRPYGMYREHADRLLRGRESLLLLLHPESWKRSERKPCRKTQTQV